jgi:hypothetical protein
MTYEDQAYVEIFDSYDYNSGEPVPSTIRNARQMNRGPFGSGDRVFIEYPIVRGLWSLSGKIGNTPFDEEAGKKAFVREGMYKHPTKGWYSGIVMMSPRDYVRATAEMFNARGLNITPEEVIKRRRVNYDFKAKFSGEHGNLFYPVLDYRTNQQEGLHRVIYAMDLGETRIPVIVIDDSSNL